MASWLLGFLVPSLVLWYILMSSSGALVLSLPPCFPPHSKSITVEKDIPLEYDLALLTAFDTNAVDEKRLEQNADDYLKELSRDGTQLLINKIFELPVMSTEDGVAAELPEQVTLIPRAKPLPKPKPLTRWEKFARIKGIRKSKRSRMVYNEGKGEWVPRWGYKGANEDGTKDWLIEVPGNADPYQDQYEKRREAKKMRITKNKAQNRRNVEEATKQQQHPQQHIQRKGASVTDHKSDLQRAIATSKTATASLGRFDKQLKGEPRIKGVRHKFEPTITDINKEKQASLSVVHKIMNKTDKGKNVVNVRKAIAQTKAK